MGGLGILFWAFDKLSLLMDRVLAKSGIFAMKWLVSMKLKQISDSSWMLYLLQMPWSEYKECRKISSKYDCGNKLSNLKFDARSLKRLKLTWQTANRSRQRVTMATRFVRNRTGPFKNDFATKMTEWMNQNRLIRPQQIRSQINFESWIKSARLKSASCKHAIRRSQHCFLVVLFLWEKVIHETNWALEYQYLVILVITHFYCEGTAYGWRA